MIRRTSLKAYEEIEAEGLLSRQRWETYKVLFHHGPLTAKQVTEAFGITGAWKRLPELRDLGVAEELGTAPCPVSGRQAIVWDVTDALPRSTSAIKATGLTRRQLEAEVDRLTRRESELLTTLRKMQEKFMPETIHRPRFSRNTPL